jgi:hypothetical protein
MAWLQDDAYIKFYVKEAEIAEIDESTRGWDTFAQFLPSVVQRLMQLFKVSPILIEIVKSLILIIDLKHGEKTILICDPTGNSVSAAILCAFMLIKYQVILALFID